MIDERTERFRPLLNDEYGNLFLGELVGMITCPSQRMHDYTMMNHTGTPSRALSYFPYSILADEPYTASVGGMRPGSSNLPAKNDRYRTSRGVLGIEEYNKLSREFTPQACLPENRFKCADWVKYHAGTADADALFGLAQANSRHLKGKGSTLSRADVEALREKL